VRNWAGGCACAAGSLHHQAPHSHNALCCFTPTQHCSAPVMNVLQLFCCSPCALVYLGVKQVDLGYEGLMPCVYDLVGTSTLAHNGIIVGTAIYVHCHGQCLLAPLLIWPPHVQWILQQGQLWVRTTCRACGAEA